MGTVTTSARIGATAFALGLVVLGPQTTGIASADTGAADSANTSASQHISGNGRHTRAGARPASATKHSKGRFIGGQHSPTHSPGPAAATPSDRPQARAAKSPAQTFASPQKPSLHQRIDAAVYRALDALSNGVSTLLPGVFEVLGQGVLIMVRRTFFDQAPTVKPAQLTGQLMGPITGTIGAADPEGDPLKYRVVQAPHAGTVSITVDGIYTYTPNARFLGTDEFIVEASDKPWPKPLWGNWIDPRRPDGTEAVCLVQQSVVP